MRPGCPNNSPLWQLQFLEDVAGFTFATSALAMAGSETEGAATQQPQQLSHVIFDLDGTLIDSGVHYFRICNFSRRVSWITKSRVKHLDLRSDGVVMCAPGLSGRCMKCVLFPTSRWSFAVVACSVSITVDFSCYFGEPSCGRCSGLCLEPSMFDGSCLCGVLSGCRDRKTVARFVFFWCSATVTRKLDNSRVQRERERDVSHALLHSFFSVVWLCYFEILSLTYLHLMCYTLS